MIVSPKNRNASIRSSSKTAVSRTDQPTLSLNQLRKNRQNVDMDVNKLHNRIKMLQLEEEKALRKIEETRKRAQKILDGKAAKD